MKAADFIFQNTAFKKTVGSTKAVELFESGLTLGEVFYEPLVWADRDLNFWSLDKLFAEYKNFEAFLARKSKYVKDLESRQETPEGSVDAINKAACAKTLEDAFRPFKRKKKTKATLAREAGLQVFALEVKTKALKGEAFEAGIESEAKKYIQPSLGFITFETVLKGVLDILVEQGLENQDLRLKLLDAILKNATVTVKAGDKYTDGGRYSNILKANSQKCSYYLNPKNYDKFPQIKKAWEDGHLKVTLDFDTTEIISLFEKDFVADGQGDLADLLKQASKKAFEIHSLPSVTTEVFDQFYAVSEDVYLSKLKSDYMSLLMTPHYGSKPVLSIHERDGAVASLVFVTHQGEFVSSTTIDFSKEDVVDNLKSLIDSITKNVELGCIAISLGPSARKFEKWIAKALKELNKNESVEVVMADPRGLSQYINQPEAKFGFEDKIDNSSLSGYLLAKRVQNPLYEYGAHRPSHLLEVPNFISKEKVDEALSTVLTYIACSSGVENRHLNTGVLKNLGWFKERTKTQEENKEDTSFDQFCSSLVKIDLKEKKSLESLMTADEYKRLAKFFKCPNALNLLDQARIAPSDFSKIKDICKDKEISLLKGPLPEIYKAMDDTWYKLLGEELTAYLKIELATPFKFNHKAYKVFSFSKGVESVEDVKEDNLYWGVVTKFSPFGAFIDIGVGTEGLVHLSELSNDFLSDARKVLKLGQWVLIKALKVDVKGKKLSFSKTKAERTSATSDRKGSGKSFRPRGENGGDRKFSKKSDRNGDDKREGSSRDDKRGDKRDFKKGDRKGARKGPRTERSFEGGGSTRKPRTPFNNPFAALGDIKEK
jgi:uncharacterized protein